MDSASKCVHELFYAPYHCGTGLAAIAQIADQAGIVCGKPAEPGIGHAGVFEEFFDLADEHLAGPSQLTLGRIEIGFFLC
jgi:hypothetical protein